MAFEKLWGERQAGRDITDETLRRLLPHSDTRGNRERGVRISTWPCITKDVRSWFEGAGWKKPSEWPEVANWLLDITEAGRDEDWERWRELARHPAQKGFACGFITPIVHCLNANLAVINSKVVKTYAAVAPTLGMTDEITPALEGYPESRDRLLGLVGRLGTIGLHGLDEWDVFCHWSVSKRLGGKASGRQRPGPGSRRRTAVPMPAIGPSRTSARSCGRPARHTAPGPIRGGRRPGILRTRVRDGAHRWIGGGGCCRPSRHRGRGFSAVVDAKTCQPGGLKNNINYEPIKGHQEQHEADFAVVVGPAFSQGNTVQHAVNRSVGLLTTDRLIELVRLSRSQALSLYVLKEILGQVGLMQPSLEQWRRSREDYSEATKAILKVFESHQRGEQSSGGLTEESIFWLLKGGGGKFPRNHISQVIRFLSNPVLGVLEERVGGVCPDHPGDGGLPPSFELRRDAVQYGEGQGIGRMRNYKTPMLLGYEAAESWARSKGCRQMASDAAEDLGQ